MGEGSASCWDQSEEHTTIQLELEAWAHPEGKCPGACTAGLSDGLGRLGVSLEELENGFLGWGPAGISVVICVRFSRHSKPRSSTALGAGTANSWFPWEQRRHRALSQAWQCLGSK